MSKWLNNKKMIWKKAVKPCHALAFCPYGPLVEEFPLRDEAEAVSCDVFGHDCPIFYHAEPFAEDEPADLVGEMRAFAKEINAHFAASKKSGRKHKAT
ncbi:MAG: hypothetical protein M0R80_26530 [Proteobacteria bacterium]|jgi:hypothetical protein|nr:hypothetical protein [Pseudomonadota bacterium]